MPPNMAPAIFAPLGLLSPFSSLLHKHLSQSHLAAKRHPALAPACGAFPTHFILHIFPIIFLHETPLPKHLSTKHAWRVCPRPAGLSSCCPVGAFPTHFILHIFPIIFLHETPLPKSSYRQTPPGVCPRRGFSNPFYFAHFSYNIPPRNTSPKTSIHQTPPGTCPRPAGLPFPIHIIFQLLLSVLYLPPLLNPLATKRHPALTPACGAFLSLKKRPIFFSSPKVILPPNATRRLPPPAGLSPSIAPHPPAFYAKPPLTGTLRPFTHRTLRPQPRRFIHDTHRPYKREILFSNSVQYPSSSSDFFPPRVAASATARRCHSRAVAFQFLIAVLPTHHPCES